MPVNNVVAIYARENGQGMAFEVTRPSSSGDTAVVAATEDVAAAVVTSGLTAVPSAQGEQAGGALIEPNDNSDPPKSGGRPRLTRIK